MTRVAFSTKSQARCAASPTVPAVDSRAAPWSAAITPRTRLFVLNSPSNPTGSVYTPEETKALGDVCVEKGVLINCAAGNVLRFIPPLIVQRKDIDHLIEVLSGIFLKAA